MSNFLWVKTAKREQMLKDLEEIPEIGKKSKSELMEMALEEFLKRHLASNNPQMKIDLFNDSVKVLGIPHLFQDDANVWRKFYNSINKKDFKELDKNLNWLLPFHEKMGREKRYV